MIQRVQSIYLFLTAIISIILFFAPVFTFSNASASYDLSLKDAFGGSGEVLKPATLLYMAILNTFILMDSLICIFMYKKRTLQIKMCMAILIMLILFIVLMFVIPGKVENVQSSDIQKAFQWASYLPAVSVILVILAMRGIKKDEALVRSADRIR